MPLQPPSMNSHLKASSAFLPHILELKWRCSISIQVLASLAKLEMPPKAGRGREAQPIGLPRKQSAARDRDRLRLMGMIH
jgi:hypothetical protein